MIFKKAGMFDVSCQLLTAARLVNDQPANQKPLKWLAFWWCWPNRCKYIFLFKSFPVYSSVQFFTLRSVKLRMCGSDRLNEWLNNHKLQPQFDHICDPLTLISSSVTRTSKKKHFNVAEITQWWQISVGWRIFLSSPNLLLPCNWLRHLTSCTTKPKLDCLAVSTN